jgi:hypothetical protein
MILRLIITYFINLNTYSSFMNSVSSAPNGFLQLSFGAGHAGGRCLSDNQGFRNEPRIYYF